MSSVLGTAQEIGAVALAQERGTDRGAQGKGEGGEVRQMGVRGALDPAAKRVGEGAVVEEGGMAIAR